MLPKLQQEKQRMQEEYDEPTLSCWWEEFDNHLGDDTEADFVSIDASSNDLAAQCSNEFSKQRELARYYEAQIELFAELCMERSYNAIFTLEKFFSYEMLVGALVDDLLPDTLRAKFGGLLLNLWIDRFPQQKLALPSQLHQILKRKEVAEVEKEQGKLGDGRTLRAELPFLVPTTRGEIVELDNNNDSASHALAEYDSADTWRSASP